MKTIAVGSGEDVSPPHYPAADMLRPRAPAPPETWRLGNVLQKQACNLSQTWGSGRPSMKVKLGHLPWLSSLPSSGHKDILKECLQSLSLKIPSTHTYPALQGLPLSPPHSKAASPVSRTEQSSINTECTNEWKHISDRLTQFLSPTLDRR